MTAPAHVFPAFLEMGLGVDLVGEDMTKAARRAVREAIGRTSLPGIGRVVPDGDRSHMRVEATVAVPRPEEVDADAVAAEFPYGQVTVIPVAGGLRTPNGTGAPGADHLVCAVAVVAVGW
ncbi:MAG TPA: Lin0512 family protein [Miltoncostaeaceae bacterium]|nr:Lin0512 family protein [Miltoncostaeaceae bacterium]